MTTSLPALCYQVMTRYPPPEAGIFGVRPPGAHPARKIRVLTELLIEHFG